MIAISWNCQGIGLALTIKALKGLRRKYDPYFVFLMETKNRKHRLEKMRKNVKI